MKPILLFSMAAIQGAAGVQPRGPEAVKVEDVKAGSGKVKGTLTLSWAPATNDATPPNPYPTYRITNTPKGCVFNGSTPGRPGVCPHIVRWRAVSGRC